jgi:hypothetical protein
MKRKIFCLLITMLLGATCFSQDDKNTQVAIRMIGHQIMLASGDSSSRVLPVETIGNTYKLRFESEFEFKPNHLVSLIDSLAKTHKISDHYIVEVEECKSTRVIYSYEMGLTSQTNLVPCENRIQPKACYTLSITLLDKKEQLKATSSSRIWEFSLLFSVAAFGVFMALKKKKKTKAQLTDLGNFELDEKNMLLIIDSQKIELSGMELKLLVLLLKYKNEIVPKELILNTVWGDEGDYIGRTLDVFISKLRKKLAQDTTVKIINIRGVGYKLVVN